MIPSQGLPTEGAEYNHLDILLFNGRQFPSLIEDVDNNGISTVHGPLSATITKVKRLMGEKGKSKRHKGRRHKVKR